MITYVSLTHILSRFLQHSSSTWRTLLFSLDLEGISLNMPQTFPIQTQVGLDARVSEVCVDGEDCVSWKEDGIMGVASQKVQ